MAENEPGIEAWKEHTSAFDRVRSVAAAVAQPQSASAIAEEALVVGTEQFDGDRYEFRILVETPQSARGHGDRLEDVFADAITLVESDARRELRHEVLSST